MTQIQLPLTNTENTKTTDDWYTPKWVFDGLKIEFDIDVASPGDGTDHVPTKQRFTIEDDGLAQNWYGVIWCNPPYSAPKKWCYRYANHPDGLILIRADLSTEGPYTALKASDAIWVPDGRLQFVNGRGKKSGGVNFSTIMLGRGKQSVEGMKRLEKIAGQTRLLSDTINTTTQPTTDPHPLHGERG